MEIKEPEYPAEPPDKGVHIRGYGPQIAGETAVISSEATGRIATAAPVAIQVDHRLSPSIAMSVLAGERSWTLHGSPNRLPCFGLPVRPRDSIRQGGRTASAPARAAGVTRSSFVAGPVFRRSRIRMVSDPFPVAAPAACVEVEHLGIRRTSAYTSSRLKGV